MNSFKPRIAVLLSACALVFSFSAGAAPAPKMELCHYNTTLGAWSLISVSLKGKSLAQHLAHGDAKPGEAIPGGDGYTFSATCEPMPVAPTITHVGDLVIPGHNQILILNQAPVDVDDPLYDPAAPDTQWVITESAFHTFEPAVFVASPVYDYDSALQIDENAMASRYGIGTTEPMIRFLGTRNNLYTYDQTINLVMGGVRAPLGAPLSLAARDRNLVTAISDFSGQNFGHSIDPLTGLITDAFGFAGDGDAPGQFRDGRFHTYSPNGLLYVLDYGNGRVQSLDPDNGYAPVAQFALEPGVTTANMQFAIDAAGRIFLGDGLGGGSAYSSAGDYLGSFAPPADHPATPEADINPYLFTDRSGHVYVFDHTGLHQYLVQP